MAGMTQTHASAARSAAPALREPRRFFPGEIFTRQAAQSASDPFTFVMSTDSVDRVGDIVEIPGIDLAGFKQNPIALLNHDQTMPIGTWSQVTKQPGQLVGKLTLADPGTSPLVDRLRTFIEQRILRAVSIGFRALAADPIDPKDPWGGVRFTKSELLECSLVSVPANPDALIMRGLTPAAIDTRIFQPALDPAGPVAAGAGAAGRQRALAPPNPPIGVRAMPRTVSERIVAHQQRAAALDDQINTITTSAANDDDRDLTAEENEQLSALAEEKNAVIKSIDTLTATEAALAARARPMGQLGATPLRVEPRFAVKEQPGAIIGKMAAVAALAHLTGRPHNEIIAERYRDDERIKDCWEYTRKAAANIADMTTPGWAKDLIRTDIGEFVDALKNVSVFAALRSRPMAPSVTFEGAGAISIPGRNRGGLGGSWIGEAGVMPVLQGTLTSILLTPTKVAGVTTFTKELQAATNGQIETILTNGLRDDTANVIDGALLSAMAARPNVRPAGLLNGVVGVPSTGDTPEAIRVDLAAVLKPIVQAGGGRDIVLIMNPMSKLVVAAATTLNGTPAFPEMDQGILAGYPFIASLNVPTGDLIAVDAADFANGVGVPDYSVSEEATLTMATADAVPPTQAIKADGTLDIAGEVGQDLGIPVVGPPTAGAGAAGYYAMSMFQQYAIALRLVLPLHWAMRRASMVGLVTGFPLGG
jgi:HK97 family phage major capsid protein/HK97 family phage prohead protease